MRALEIERERILARLREISDREDRLIVRAPVSGTVITTDLSTLVGQHYQIGQEVMLIADESSQEVVAYAGQKGTHVWLPEIGQRCAVRTRSDASSEFLATATRVTPRLSTRGAASALLAVNGGPLAANLTQDAHGSATWETTVTHAEAQLAIPSAQATQLRVGPTGYLESPDVAENLGTYLGQKIRRWLNKHVTCQRSLV
jgi:hypothetical protein